MRQIVATIFFTIALVGAAAWFAWKITRADTGYDETHAIIDTSRIEQIGEAIKTPRASDWTEQMAHREKLPRLPADESAVGIDLVDPKFRENITLVLRLNSPDIYEKQCAEAFFAARAVGYKIEDGDFYEIALTDKDPDAALELLRALATYDLNAQAVVRRTPKPY
ncbi:MAG: hypothetical protein LBU73_05725 [Helicobacteraceae bacterium]|nr:hypothetical protein [Helicobacteraceae bacterium]